MKVYVSKKDIEENNLNFIEDENDFLFNAELESALTKAVDSCLQYEEGEQINFTKKQIEQKTKEFTNLSINLDNQRIAELKQAKQEVINELLNWVTKSTTDNDGEINDYYIEAVDLKQKLNQMKEVK